MVKVKYTYEDFISNIGEEHLDFYHDVRTLLTERGFKSKVELKKTGYALTYIQSSNKKTLINFVNRKKGMFMRLYSNHTDAYMDKIMTLPENMIKELKKGQVCKRMIDPDACNSKCKMGVNLLIDGQVHAKCRYSALFFHIEADKYKELLDLIESETNERLMEISNK
jgi:hypothetical protein